MAGFPALDILYVTCAENGLFGLRRLVAQGARIAAVVTIPPELGARHAVAGYADVRPFCAAHGLRVVSLPRYAMTPEDVRGIGFDLIVVNGWNRLLPAEVMARAPAGGLGVHAGHPPIGHGRAPLVWNILLGRPDLEVYVFRLTPDADDGDILALRVVEITPQDDVRTLYEKVMLAAAGLFAEAIGHVAAGARGVPQDRRFARAYGKRTPEDGLIDFSAGEREVFDFIRAQAPPYPGAFTHLDGRRWTILRAQPFDRFAFRDVPRQPGLILEALPAGLVVQTGGAPIWLTAAEVEGRPALPAPLEEVEKLVGRRFTPTP
jgi:methionyl-tRNA formyltransferase